MGKGRGHKKIEQSGAKKKISSNNGTPLVYLPKSLLDLGVRLNQEVTINYNAGSNTMLWEIKIKPALQPEDDKDDTYIDIGELLDSIEKEQKAKAEIKKIADAAGLKVAVLLNCADGISYVVL